MTDPRGVVLLCPALAGLPSVVGTAVTVEIDEVLNRLADDCSVPDPG